MTAVRSWLRDRCESFLFLDYRRSADALGLYRIAFAGYVLFLGGVPSFRWIAGHPAGFFAPPPGLPRLFTGFPPLSVLAVLDATLFVLLVLLLVGLRTRAVSIGITALLLVGKAWSYSFGKIDHDILFVLTPLVFAASWGHAFSLDGRRRKVAREYGASLAVFAALIAFGFFTAGVPKLLGGWVDFDLNTHGVKGWVLRSVELEQTELLVPFFASLRSQWIWEVLDVAAVVFELGFGLALLAGPRAFRVFVGLAVVFHCANHLMLNIAFEYHLPVLMAFLDWEGAAARVRRAEASDKRRRQARLLIGSMAAAVALVRLAWWLRSGDPWALLDLRPATDLGGWRVSLLLGAAVAVTLTVAARASLAHAQDRRAAFRSSNADPTN